MIMNPIDDWRRQGQETFLKGVTLIHRSYRQHPSNPKWDHDHCEFCGTKFQLEKDHNQAQEAYATDDDSHWVCPTCFEDFKHEFGWIVQESPPDTPPLGE